MKDWFIWNGTTCAYYGITVTERPEIVIPDFRTTQAEIPGRPGKLTIAEGVATYDNYELKLMCFMQDVASVSTVAAWLSGRGTLTIPDKPGYFCYARLSGGITFERILRGRDPVSFEVTFECEPFWYAIDEAAISTTSTALTIVGDGNIYTEPLITFTGTGSFNLVINGTIMYIDDIDGAIYIDCAAGIAYAYDDGNMVWAGEHISLEDGEWPTLQPSASTNLVSVAATTGSTFTSLSIQPRWRWL